MPNEFVGKQGKQMFRKIRANLGVRLSTHGELLGDGTRGGFWKEKKIYIKRKERIKYFCLKPEKNELNLKET